MTTSSSSSRGFSFEFFPPKSDAGRRKLLATVNELAALAPRFVSVTFGAGGSTREGSFQTTSEIMRNTRMNVTPHLSCISSSRAEIDAMLDLYQTVGVKRIVALRGDLPEGHAPDHQDFRYANELVGFVKARGGFHISVACYPEFHPEAPDAGTDIQNFVRKVRAGADEAISQYFYTNEAYYRFVEETQRMGVDIPIVPGVMPMTDYTQVARFSSFCGADIPQWIRKRMEQYRGDAASQEALGIELATRQIEDLMRNGAPGIHVYTLNRAEPTLRIWQNLGLQAIASTSQVSTTASN